MKLPDFKTFDWEAFAKKMLTPKPIFPKKRKVNENGLEYASFSVRMLSLTLDMCALQFILGMPMLWISTQFFPDFDVMKVREVMTNALQQVATGQASAQDILAVLQHYHVLEKLAFDYTLQIMTAGALVIYCWQRYAATPGMKLLGLYIADATTGEKPPLARFIIRYLGVILAMLPLAIGFLWVVFDKRNQGWQDKIAHTVVLRRTDFWKFWKKST
jgi:hypothetical protein